MRLIDADDIIVKLEAKRNNWDNKNAMHRAMRGAYVDSILIVRDAPTVEAEPDKGWISVRDRMPENGTALLIYCPEFVCTIKLAMWIEDGFYVDGEDLIIKADPNGYCTHWMPLPEPPEPPKEKCDWVDDESMENEDMIPDNELIIGW